MSEIEEQGAPLESAGEPLEEAEDQVEHESKPLPPFVKLLILVGAVLVLVTGAYFLVQKVVLPQVKGIAIVERMTEVKQRLQEPKKEEEEERRKGPVIPHEITGIVANIAGSAGRDLIVIDMIVETTSEDSRDAMIAREYQIRDALILYFGERTLNELLSIQFQIVARDTVRSIINAIIEDEPVDAVFFTNFLIQ